MNAVLSLSKEAAKKGVVTHSSGNHAQALAVAAKCRGIAAHIVMPSNAPQVKKDAVAGYGATITECEPTDAARSEAAGAIQTDLGCAFIHPSNAPAVMAGQGTMALEVLQQIPTVRQSLLDTHTAQMEALLAMGIAAVPPPSPPAPPQGGPVVDAIVVPLGGGGMLSGIAIAIKSIDPRILVIAGEPAGAADAAASVLSGELQDHAAPPTTIADGLRTTLGSNTWPIVRAACDGIITVSDAEILTGMQLLWTRAKLAVEPSAGVGIATILSSEFKQRFPRVRTVAVIVCGGNLDVSKLPLAPMDE
jgi:threonine dehydratase